MQIQEYFYHNSKHQNPILVTLIITILLLGITLQTQSSTTVTLYDYIYITENPSNSYISVTLNPYINFTSSSFSFSFWIQNNSILYSQAYTIISHQNTSSSSMTYFLNISLEQSNQQLAIINTSPLVTIPFNMNSWNFVYVGIQCSSSSNDDSSSSIIYYQSSNTFTPQEPILYSSYSDYCPNQASNIDLLVNPNSGSSSPFTFNQFRYYNYLMNDMFREIMSFESVAWVWLRFDPADIQEEIIYDYARSNLIFRGTGYAIQSINSLIVLSDYAFPIGNYFPNTAAITTIYADYLSDSYIVSFWFSVEDFLGSNTQSTSITFFKKENSDMPGNAGFIFGMQQIGNASQFTLFLNIYNFIGSNSSNYTSINASNVFVVNNGINPYWYYVQLKYDQNNILNGLPNFIEWKLLDSNANIIIDHQDYTDVSLIQYNSKFSFNGFIGYISDVRIYKGIFSTSNIKDISNCGYQMGTTYGNFTSQTIEQYTTKACLICTNSTYTNINNGQCVSTCPQYFSMDANTSLCRCTTGNCLADIQCNDICNSCNAISNVSCLDCPSDLLFFEQQDTCLVSCPNKYINVSYNDTWTNTMGNMCNPSAWYSPNATLNIYNETLIYINFSSNMAIFSTSSGDNSNIAGILGGCSSSSTISDSIFSTITVTMFQVSSNPYDNTDFFWCISNVDSQSITINITYLQTLPIRYIQINFTEPDSIKDINGYGLNPTTSLLQGTLQNIWILSSEQVQQITVFINVAKYAIIIIAICLIFLIINGNLVIFWWLIDCCQMLNYLLYFNVQLPLNVQYYFQNLSWANSSFMPNFFDYLINWINIGCTSEIEKQVVPPFLSQYGHIQSVNFFDNAGKALSFMLLSGSFIALVKIMSFIPFKNYRILKFWTQVGELASTAFVRVYFLAYLQIGMAVCLQLNNIYFVDGILSYLSVFSAVFFGVLLVGLPIYFVVSIERSNLQRKKGIIYFGPKRAIDNFQEEFSDTSFISRNFAIWILFRKVYIVPVILFLSDQPLMQIGFFINLTLNVLLLIIVKNIYAKFTYKIINLVSELGILSVGSFMFWLQSYSQLNNIDENLAFSYGNYILGACLFNLLTYLLFCLYAIVKTFYDYFKFYKEKYGKREDIGLENSLDGIELINSKNKLIKQITGDSFHNNPFQLNEVT